MSKRKRDDLHIEVTSVQSSIDRFGKGQRHDPNNDIPQISEWRCNLTALSQRNNLYFVAYGCDIHVYVPRFPSQALTRYPALIIRTQPSAPDLGGSLDRREPHSINRLIVQFLGTEEVVATVRDDGDVDVVLVRHVLQGIKRRREPENQFGLVAAELRPLFQSNVSLSAWGLAIHSQARILAVSSNRREVHVFKFGLVQADEDEKRLERSIDCGDGGVEQRQLDAVHRLHNGDANVPEIAFCNTGDDPTGRWLLTTDISGYSRAMDLHSEGDGDDDIDSQAYRFGRSWTSMTPYNIAKFGWGIMFLDRRSFRVEHDFRTALGLDEEGELPGVRNDARIWDLSRAVGRLKDVPIIPTDTRSGDLRVDWGAQQPRQASTDTEHESSELTTDRIGEDDAPTMAGEAVGVLVDGGSASGTDVPLSTADDAEASSEMDIDTHDVARPHAGDIRPDRMQEIESEDPDREHLTTTSIGAYDDDNEVDSDDQDSDDTPFGGRLYDHQPYFFDEVLPCPGLPCPILHASGRNVYLLQPAPPQAPVKRSDDHEYSFRQALFPPPMIGLVNPLRECSRSPFRRLDIIDRLNMHAYVPALGVVVLASQKGGALVLALTKLPTSTSFPAGMQPKLQPGKSAFRRRSIYAFRPVALLPTASQEQADHRPLAPLHGVAVGPMQGTEGLREEHRRWRLMMMYQDHSVLSYEIKRSSRQGAGMDIADLVV